MFWQFNWWVLDWLHVWPICKYYLLNSISESCEFEWRISIFELLNDNRDSLLYCLVVEFDCESNLFLCLNSFLSQLLFLNHDRCIVNPISPRFLIIEFYSLLSFASQLVKQNSNFWLLVLVNLVQIVILIVLPQWFNPTCPTILVRWFRNYFW